jgi:hypothetical protein
MLGQLALVAGDVEASAFGSGVGRVGLPAGAPSSCVNIDCTDRYKALPDPDPLNPIKTAEYSHCWYFTDANLYRDLAQTLRGAVDRNVVAARTGSDGTTLGLAV